MDSIIELDKHLLLLLNGSGNPILDQMMWTFTKTATWLPLAAMLLYIVWKNNAWRPALMVVLSVALVIFLADRVSSGVFKPLFHRFRPSHEPTLEGLVHLVNGYAGGRYGFISSHAANTFGVATFLGLLMRSSRMTTVLFCWACLSSYSRIYLGVHYPFDILAGATWGCIAGTSVYALHRYLSRKYASSNATWSYKTTTSGYHLSDINWFIALFCMTIAMVALSSALAIPLA